MAPPAASGRRNKGAVPWEAEEFDTLITRQASRHKSAYNLAAASLLAVMSLVGFVFCCFGPEMAPIEILSVALIPSGVLYMVGYSTSALFFVLSAMGFFRFLVSPKEQPPKLKAEAAPYQAKKRTTKTDSSSSNILRQRSTYQQAYKSPSNVSPIFKPPHFKSPLRPAVPGSAASQRGGGARFTDYSTGTPSPSFAFTPRRRLPYGASPQRASVLDTHRSTNDVLSITSPMLTPQINMARSHVSSMSSPQYGSLNQSSFWGSPAPRGGRGGNAQGSPLFGQGNVSIYEPSYGESPTKAAVGIHKIDDPRSDPASRLAFQDLIQKIKLGGKTLNLQDKIYDVAQEMRYWLGTQVMPQVSFEIKECERELSAWSQELLQIYGPKLTPDEQKALKDPVERVALLFQKVPNDPRCHRRRRLQKYLDVPAGYGLQASAGAASSQYIKAYVANRITELAEGLGFNGYVWNKGSPDYKGAVWTSSLPSDAQIVTHCFLSYMDDITGFFTRNHFRDQTVDTSAINQVAIVQTRKTQIDPYFMVRVKEGSKTVDWRIEPGRNNLFLALSMFMLYVHKELKGRIGGVLLTDACLNGLGQVVSSV